MKEYIKTFTTPQAGSNYLIADLPWLGFVDSTLQNLRCVIEDKRLKQEGNLLVIEDVPVPTKTKFYYDDGTTSESEDVIITSDSYNNEKILTSVEIGTCATSIGYMAFNCCSDLTSVTIPNSITSIGESAFKECFGLTSITIPNSVTSIEQYAFELGTTFTTYFESTIPNIPLEDGEGNTTDIFNMGGSSPSDVTIIVPTGCREAYIAKDNGWEAYADYIQEAETPTTKSVFYYSDATTSESNDTVITSNSYNEEKTLSSVMIGTCVTSIGENAFSSCDSLTSIVIPDSVTSIGDNAFANCSGLTSVTIGNSVTSIGDSAFRGCNLSHITIPASVTSIEDYAFDPNSGSAGVTIDATFESTTPVTLVSTGGSVIHIFGQGEYMPTPTIHVPVGYENTYATHDAGWEALAQYIVQ